MTEYSMTGDATLRHLADLARLSGHPRSMYLEQIERAHGADYRLALAREDMRRREAIEVQQRAVTHGGGV